MKDNNYMNTSEQREDTNRDSGLAGIILIARYYGIPADEEKLRHEFNLADRRTNMSILLRIAKSMKLKARCMEDIPSEKLNDIVVLQIKLCSILQIIRSRFLLCYVNGNRLFGVDSALCFI